MAHSKDPFKALTDGLKEMIIQLGIAIVKAAIFEAIMAAMSGGGQSSGGSGEFTLRGNDLVLALQRSNYSLNLRRWYTDYIG